MHILLTMQIQTEEHVGDVRRNDCQERLRDYQFTLNGRSEKVCTTISRKQNARFRIRVSAQKSSSCYHQNVDF